MIQLVDFRDGLSGHGMGLLLAWVYVRMKRCIFCTSINDGHGPSGVEVYSMRDMNKI